MDRRTFLKWAALATAVLGGVWSVRAFSDLDWLWRPAASGFKVLDEDEAAIVRALAAGVFPGDEVMPSGSQCGLDMFVDDYLAVIPKQTATLLKLLLYGMDRLARLDFGGPLASRNAVECVAVVRAWDESSLGLRRSVFQSVKLILAMGYYEHPQVLGAAGLVYECGMGEPSKGV